MRVSQSELSFGFAGKRRGRGRRRVAVVVLLAMALGVGAPAGTVPPGGEFPMAWLWSWLGQRPAWAAFTDFDALPKQGHALGRDIDHYVSGKDTRASTGTGRDAGRAPGALDADKPLTGPPKAPWTVPSVPNADSFDPKTSRKVPGRSNAGADTYENADGSFTRTVSSGTTNFRDSDGSWKPIDTTLVRRGGRLHMAANSLDVSVADQVSQSRAAQASLASVTLPTGQAMRYGLAGAAAVAAVVDGSTAKYPNVLPGTDLELVTLEAGLKETLILKSPEAANSWVFPLQLDGLTPHLGKDGSVELRDAKGTAVAWIPAGTMWDSRFDPERGTMATSAGVSYELITHDGAPALRVTADRVWLDDPARVYPVFVDPTTTTLTTADVFVDNDSTTGASSQNGHDLTVGTFNDGGIKARSFVRFDHFDDDGLMGDRITGARLKVYLSWTYDCNHPTSVSVYKVTSNWGVVDLSTSGLYGPSVSGPIGSGTPADNYPACTNTTGNRDIGEWHTITLNPATFNSWSTGATANYGLALIGPESGTNSKYGWKRYTAANHGATYQPRLEVDWAANVAPQVNRQYPPSYHSASSLTPELVVDGKDPDAWPNPIKYNFMVYDKNATKIAESGLTTARSWAVPSGELAWGESYFWTVVASDGLKASTSQTMNVLSTPVPQPLVTSALAQNGGQGFDVTGGGNYTTSATDAAVATVGPALAITRSYNSRDARVGTAFGGGWASIVDAKATEHKDALDNVVTVVVTYPTGQEVAFGRNADNTFTSPPGRFATFTSITGGYRLVDKDGTAYSFTGATGASGQFRLASLTDPQGRAQTFGFDGAGLPTSITSASGRSLQLAWTTPPGASAPHVESVTTDRAIPEDPTSVSTWAYTYEGDRLMEVCPPTSATACTTYTYTAGSLYPSTVLNAGPRSYWRLGDASGAAAVSSVRTNAGTDNGTYSNVTLGQPGPLPGSTATAATFNGTSSSLEIPAEPLSSAAYHSISLWFKVNSGDRGPLLGYSVGPITSATAGSYTPALYVGTSGKLYGQFWNGSGNPIATTTPVTDGQWHHVVLSAAGNTQELYVDGVSKGTRTGQVTSFGAKHAYIGAGFWGSSWPDQPNTNPAQVGYFKGSIAEVAYFDRWLTAENVAAIRQAGAAESGLLASAVRPSGRTSASMLYDGSSGDLTQVTDANGGVWQVGVPTVTGSHRVHSAAVLGASPKDYFRFAENGAAEAVNEVNGGDAMYSGVTLGVAGGPFDDPGTAVDDTSVAGFNGTSSYLTLPSGDWPTTGPSSVSAWFKLPTGTSGVLYGYQTTPVTNSGATGWVPALYVGTDGKLRGKFWNGTTTAITTSGAVNDNNWHHVVLAASSNSQAMYVDGVKVGTIAGNLIDFGAQFAHVGAGKWSTWVGASAAAIGYWPGQIAEFAFYPSQLSDAQVSTQFAARSKSSGSPVKTVVVTDPGTNPITYVYDVATGRKVSETDPLGNQTRYGYDTGGFLRTVTDPMGNVTTTEHDVRGNTISSKTCQSQATNKCSTVFNTFYPDATTAVLTPDPRNDVMLTVRDGRSASATDDTYKTTYAYDASGNRTSATDPLGRVTTTSYTTAATPAFGGGVTPAGLPMSMTTAGGATQTIEYFPSGDVARIADPAGKVTTFTYDGLGRVVTKTDTTGFFDAGLTTTIEYDKASRVVSQTSPAVTNRVTGAIHTAVSTTQYTVDGQTEVQTVSDTTGGDAPRTVSATYNVFGQQETSTDAAGKTTTYEYDAYGRIVREIGADLDVVESEFDAKGQLLTTTVKNFTGDPNAPSAPTDLVVVSRAYDPAGRLATVTDAMGWQTLYAYTDNGLAAKVTRKDPAEEETFVQQETVYDGAGHVITSTTNDGATVTTYEVDAAGRTTKSTVDAGGLNRVTTVTYSKDDFVVNITSGSGGAISSTDTIFDPLGREVASTTGNGALAPVGRWRLDDGSGTSARDSAGNSPATTSGGVTWSGDHGGSAVFDGIGGTAIATGGAVLDTARSFTVSAWVKLDAGTTGNKTAVSQDGQRHAGFFLSYEASTDKWRMMMCPPQPGPGNCVSALSTSAPVRDTWTHLTGVYDDATGKIRLYVNGAFEKEVSKTTAWSSAVGPLRIGRAKWNGGLSDHWPGSVSDVQAYQRALTNAQVADVYGGSLPAAGASVVRTSTVLDESGLPLSQTNANGQTTDYSLDEAGRIAVVTRPAVMTESAGGTPLLTRPVSYTGYDTFGAVVETKNPNGNVTVTAYDAAGRVDTVTMPDYIPPGSSTAMTAVSDRDYNDVGQLITAIDPLGNETNYHYDQLGRVARIVTADLGVVKYTYDLVGDQLSMTDPTGAVRASTYDYLGRPKTSTQVVRQSGASYTTTYAYGPGGWLASTQSPEGVVTSSSYNAVGQPLEVTDGANKSTTFTYDALGRPARTTLADDTYSTVTYDAFGRPTASSSYDAADALLKTTSSVYDAAGNVIETVDALGHSNTFTYDATGLLTTQVQPINASDAITTSFGYDISGNRTRFTDGRGNAFLTTYNSWGLPESQIEPATQAYAALADRTFTTSYDKAGRVASRVEPGPSGGTNDVVITYTYDAMGRLTAQNGTGAEVATAGRSFDYDQAGRLIEASAPGAANVLTYDDRGLLLSVTGGSGNSSFGYNADSQLASRTDAAGTTSYGYDSAGRLATVTNPTVGAAATYAYNDLSQVSKITYGSSGNARWLDYDPLHRLETDELKTPGPVVNSIAKITYGWDDNNNLTSKTTTGFVGSTENIYTYDWANRLTSWDNGTTPVLYAYDKSGNRVQAGTSLFEYDERNQLKTASGNLVYGYTPRGTLSSVTTVGVSTLQTQTDAFGQVRTQAVTPTQDQQYEYDGLGRLVRPNAAYTGLGNTLASDGTATYARDPAGTLIGVAAGGAQRLVWTDLHTDVVAQFDATSTSLAASTTYEPFGKVAATTSMIGTLGYQSEFTDALTGRVNMHARWYNPETGQFDTRDSVSVSPVPSSVRGNRFGYADASPLVNTDPTGHWSVFSWVGDKVSAGFQAAKSVYNAGVSAAKSLWNSVTGVAKQVRNSVNKRLAEFEDWAQTKVEQAKTVVKDVVDKTKKVVNEGKKWVNEQTQKVKEKVKQTVDKVKQAGQKLITEATRVVTQTVNDVKDAYKAAETWVKENKDMLLEVAAIAGSVLAGVACAAVTAGVGALACMAGAAALINLAKDAGQGKIENFGDVFQSAGIGALQGALGGAGGMLGGKIAAGLASKLGGGLWGRIGGGALGGGLADGASGAAISAGTQLIEEGHIDGGKVANDALLGAAFGAGIGGPFGARKKPPGCNKKHSFAPGTRVLMADGTTRPIEDVNIGDKVLATNPETGKTQAKPVTALHLNRDRDLTNVTVGPKAPKSTKATTKAKAAVVAAAALAGVVLATTAHHPFWDATTETWTDAADLKTGHSTLLSPDGTNQQITTVTHEAGVRDMRDLTVADIHTYYVLAGNTPVLVHNCSDALEEFADDNIGKTNVASEVTNVNGAHGYGISEPRELVDLTPEVRTAVQATGHHGGCAEVGALCDLESQGQPLTGLTADAVKVTGGSQGHPPEEHLDPLPMCQACERLFEYLNGK